MYSTSDMMSATSIPKLIVKPERRAYSERLFTIRQQNSHLYGVQLTQRGPAYILAFTSEEDCHQTKVWLQRQYAETGSWPRYAIPSSAELKLQSATYPDFKLQSEADDLFVNPVTLPGLLGVAAMVHIAMIEKSDCSRYKARLRLREMIELQLGLEAFRMHLINREHF